MKRYSSVGICFQESVCLFAEEFNVSRPTSPLQPVIFNFNAAHVASWIPRDNDAIRGLTRSLVRDKVLVDWYKRVEEIFFGSGADSSVVQHVVPSSFKANYPAVLDLVDLSVSEDVFSRVLASGFQGLNLDSILNAYFAAFEGTIKTLVLPQFFHVAQLGPLSTLQTIKLQKVKFHGVTSLQYVVDIIKVLAQTPYDSRATGAITLLVEKLDFGLCCKVHPQSVARSEEYFQSLLDVCPGNIKVFIQDVEGLRDEQVAHVVKAVKNLSSFAFRQVLGEEDTGEKTTVIFYSAGEIPEGSINDEPLLECGKEETPGILKMFSLAKEVDSFLNSEEMHGLAQGLPRKVQVLMKAAAKGYEGALHILQYSSLADAVSCLDLRMDELKVDVTEVDITSPGSPKGMLLTMPECMRLATNITIEDDRIVSLSRIFRALSLKSSPGCEIQEIVLPPLQHVADIEEIFTPNLWRKCREVYLTGSTRLDELIQILRSLPKGVYPLNIHVPDFKMSCSLPAHSSRDFDSPSCVNVIIYQFGLNDAFFCMPTSTVKTIYEICLKLSSVTLLRKLKEHCQSFLDSPATFPVPYNSTRCYEGCQTLLAYLVDALNEEILSDEESLLTFADTMYKYQVMSSAVGLQRFRRAFKPISPQNDASSFVLPTNRYKRALTETSTITSALKEGKIENVTVAIFGMGINALHPEFFTKLGHVRKSTRERGCPFGDSVIGMAFNVVARETMATFLDEDGSIGTTAAALIAGANCGAAPFANIISVKVGMVSGSVKPKWVIEGIRWLIDQESRGKLPPSDVILIPFTFGHFNHRLYLMVNQLCSAGKIVVCAAGKSSPVDEHRIAYPASYGDVICIGKYAM